MAGLAVRFRNRTSSNPNMAALEEDEIQLVEDTSNKGVLSEPNLSQSSLDEEVHPEVAPARFSHIKRELATSLPPLKKMIGWWVTAFILGVASFLLVFVPLLLEQTRLKQECHEFENVIGSSDYEEYPFIFNENKGTFAFCRRGQPVLEGILGMNHTPLSEVKVDVYRHSSNTVLNITRRNANCLRMEWVGQSSRDRPIEDCYTLGGAHWYSAHEFEDQRWPINGLEIPTAPFLPNDYLSETTNRFGPVLHPLWLTSNGSGILVDEAVQLHVKMTNTTLCLIAEPFELECVPTASDEIVLSYTICNFNTLPQTVKFFLNESGDTPHPPATPDHSLYLKPIWSTWAETKTVLSDDALKQFYQNISSNRFPISQLEIDDGYSQHYGDLSFNKNVSSSVLKELSTQVNLTAWVHPFVNNDAEDFQPGVVNDHFLPGFFTDESNSIALVKWWQGYGAVINFLRSNTTEWHKERLEAFVNANHLSSLKFDAGEFTYMPKCIYIHGLKNNPGMFTQAYVQFVTRQFYSQRAEVRVGYFTQGNPVLVRLLDRRSSWGVDGGLKSVLNAVLSLGLGGYGFVLPDMIGGNGQDATDLKHSKPPEMELYVRWLQLNTFLPFLQFSLGPWRYNNSTLMEHVRNMTSLHAELSRDHFIPLSEELMEWGFPTIRPLWWLSTSEPADSAIWTIDNQFLIGDQLMVAPVMEPNSTGRSVYFPQGTHWTPMSPAPLGAAENCVQGGCGNGATLNFKVQLWEVLFFRKNE